MAFIQVLVIAVVNNRPCHPAEIPGAELAFHDGVGS